MKFNKWTMGLAAIGVVSLASAARADETKMNQVLTAGSSTTLSGYADVAAVFNPGGIANQYSYAKANGFYLNLFDLTLDKPMGEGTWASGYHVDLNIGPDSVGGGALLGNGAGLRQAYLALGTPVGKGEIDWKLGVMDSIIGYESNADPANPNYTRSWGYTIEPTTLTGIVGTYKVNNEIAFTAGLADTVFMYPHHHNTNPWLGVNAGGIAGGMANPSVLGSFTLTAPDNWGWVKGATFNAGAINSPSQWGAGATSWYAGVTVPTPWTPLTVGGSYDLLVLHDASHHNANEDNIWDIALYGDVKANEKLSFNLRGEYLNQRNAGFSSMRVVLPIAREAEELTATVQYKIWDNVLSRAEIRWDHAEHGTPFVSNSGNSADANAFTFAVNLIYQF